ncbi:hypothetical protein BH23BAC2_BH23BAC2_19420 [soil metagenome]
MRKPGFILFFICISFWANAQEIPMEVEVPAELLLKRVEMRPSLSNLSPDIPNTGRFKIRTVNFDTQNLRREIDMVAVMEREAQMKARTIELAPPVQVPQSGNTAVTKNETFGITPRFFNPSVSPEGYGPGTRNSVYRDAGDATGANYIHTYSPFVRGYGYGYGRYGRYYY